MMLTCRQAPPLPQTTPPPNPNPALRHFGDLDVRFPCEFGGLEEHFGVLYGAAKLKAFPSSMAGNLKGWWRQRREELALQQRDSSILFYIPSPAEGLETDEPANERALRAKHCTEEGVKAGFKAATIACVASAVPTLTAVRTIPWFKANLNYTGQALIISAVTIATYFIVTDQTIHECSRQGSYDALVKRRSGVP